MRVLILGGGFCGSMVAKKLDSRKDLKVSLIDKKPYFEYYPSLPKLITDPGYHENIVKPYSQFLEEVEIIDEEVIEITPEYISTNKRKMNFDFSVISLGAKYPIYLEDKRNIFTIRSGEEVKELAERVKKAQDILVVGGGLIGTETAAELACKTEKEITLVHSHQKLIERNPKMASFIAEKYLKEKGVKMILDQKVIDRDGKYFITDENEQIKADVCIWSTGLSYDKDLFSGFENLSVTESGTLNVNENLQVKGHPNIFAGGDITDIEEEKTGHNADSHSRIIAKNILRKKEGLDLKSYTRFKVPLFISLGDVNGLISLPGLALPGPLPVLGKHALEKGEFLRL